MSSTPISREEFLRRTAAAQDCEARAFPTHDAVHVADLVDEFPWLTEPHMRMLYQRGEICHWRVGRKIFVSRADFMALLDSGLNASLKGDATCAPKAGA